VVGGSVIEMPGHRHSDSDTGWVTESAARVKHFETPGMRIY